MKKYVISKVKDKKMRDFNKTIQRNKMAEGGVCVHPPTHQSYPSVTLTSSASLSEGGSYV